MSSIPEIVRCLVSDLGTPLAARDYARRIAAAQGPDAAEYAEAAERLDASLDQEEPFRLRNAPPKTKKWEPPVHKKGNQKLLFTGLDCLPGQQDLFDC